MTEFTISRENFLNFLSSFGRDLSDIVVKVSSQGISAAVGQETHYISRKMDCGTSQTGNVYITDIPKLKAFLANTKTSDLSVNQSGKTATLHVRCGTSSLQLPTSSYIQSQEKVGLIGALIR